MPLTSSNAEPLESPAARWSKVWNHRVHEKLGETLFYYFVRTRPFHPQRAKTDLDQIIKSQKLGSIRVFPLFGPYDLLVRAWLYPTIANRFSDFLDSGLRGYRDVAYFAVTHIYHRWYSKGINRPQQGSRQDGIPEKLASTDSLLEALDEPTIRRVEAGKDPDLEKRLINAHLLVERPKREELIRFFLPIRFAESTPGIVSTAVRDLAAYLQQNPKFQSWSLYGGYGFCSLLISASVSG